MKRSYHVLRKNGRSAERRLAVELARQGQPLWGMLELIGQCCVPTKNSVRRAEPCGKQCLYVQLTSESLLPAAGMGNVSIGREGRSKPAYEPS